MKYIPDHINFKTYPFKNNFDAYEQSKNKYDVYLDGKCIAINLSLNEIETLKRILKKK